MTRLVFTLAALGAALAVIGPQDSAGFTTAGFPAEMVAGARLTERRCAKCHTLSRIIDAPWTGSEWHDTVKTMADKEKSGISGAEAAKIEAFLSYWSTHKSGQPAGSASRPARAASRPAVFGGNDAYPSPAATIFASAPVPATAEFPVTLQLANVKIDVRSIAIERSPESTQVTARVDLDGRTEDLVLARDAAGKFSPVTRPLRNWTIGPHDFALVLALYQTSPLSDAARVDATLALLVTRWSPPAPK